MIPLSLSALCCGICIIGGHFIKIGWLQVFTFSLGLFPVGVYAHGAHSRDEVIMVKILSEFP